MLGHFFGIFLEGGALTRRQVIHPDAVTFDTYLLQKTVDITDSFPASKISLVVVTVPLQTTDAVDTVGPFLKASQQVHHIHFSGAGDPDDFYISGITQPHRTCQVRS
jgi:hypothetical protein